VVYGTGKFEVTGSWKSIGTTHDIPGYTITKPTVPAGGIGYHSIIPGIWVETGRRIYYDNENTTPTTGQDAYTPQSGDYVCLQTDPTKPFGRIVSASPGYIVVDAIHTGNVLNNDGLCIVKDTSDWTLDR